MPTLTNSRARRHEVTLKKSKVFWWPECIIVQTNIFLYFFDTVVQRTTHWSVGRAVPKAHMRPTVTLHCSDRRSSPRGLTEKIERVLVTRLYYRPDRYSFCFFWLRGAENCPLKRRSGSAKDSYESHWDFALHWSALIVTRSQLKIRRCFGDTIVL